MVFFCRCGKRIGETKKKIKKIDVNAGVYSFTLEKIYGRLLLLIKLT